MNRFEYFPRTQFEAFHQRKQRDALMVCHRRAGKTVACVGELIVRALYADKKNARYGYVAPFRGQAKEIAWTYLKDMASCVMDGPPRESELRVKLINGAWITLYGADNPDALRGMYFDGLILDEFGDMKPSLMGEVILPCLSDREGWLVIIGTPKGRNQFYEYKKIAEESDKWFFQILKASESHIIPEEELARLKDTMLPEQYEQEMECSFDAAIKGTYYAELINSLAQNGQLIYDRHLYNPLKKVHIAADIGLRDSTSWWFWQPTEDGYNVIDFFEGAGHHVDFYLHMLADKNYDYHEIWLPHDSKMKRIGTRRTTLDQFRNPRQTAIECQDHELLKKYPDGFVYPVRMVPKLSIQHGIDAARLVMKRCTFDMTNCYQGLDALRQYRRQWHEHSQSYSDVPKHDWASHAADGFRYMAVVAEKSVGSMAESPVETAPGYTLDELWAEREQTGRSGIIRI